MAAVILSSAIWAHIYSEAVDMRKSIDAPVQIVSLCMDMNPLSGQVFMLIGRRRDKAKLLVWDRHRFRVLYKRLERGRFADSIVNPNQRGGCSDSYANGAWEVVVGSCSRGRLAFYRYAPVMDIVAVLEI